MQPVLKKKKSGNYYAQNDDLALDRVLIQGMNQLCNGQFISESNPVSPKDNSPNPKSEEP